MTDWIQLALVLVLVLATAQVLGGHLWQVYDDRPQPWLDRWLRPVEDGLLRWVGDRGRPAEGAWDYLRPLLVSNLVFGAVAFLLLLLQPPLLNPAGLPGMRWDTALHTTISFLTNTDQQHYVPEQSLSDLSQLGALQFLFFTSAATGLAVGFAFIRGLCGRPLGNFHRDLIRSITRVLLPLSLVFGLVLLLCGSPMTLAGPVRFKTLEGATQILDRGPVAAFEAIKQLGENGGGFFNANSAHPFENPSPFTNLLALLAMVAIPAATIDAFGRFLGQRRQAALLLLLVTGLFLAGALVAICAEQGGNPRLATWLNGPNLEGKEVRFGAGVSALFATMATGSMTGAANAAYDSLMPLGALVALFNLFLQVVFGGQGTGVAYLLVFLILTVFLTGLMVGRTPELFGRKVEKAEVVWSSVILLLHPLFVLVPAAITIAFPSLAAVGNPGFHGLTEVVYEYASASANNGSGMAGLGNSSPWWNLSCVVSLLGGRYLPIVALLFLAAGFARKQPVPPSPGTLATDTPLFTVVTAVVVLILGALTFFPVLALGPIAEAFSLSR
ncbi:MAG: potassium ABC transporter ATPase [Cyanobium sp. CACIAM 14]|nr:MAG: potassium ABC transporter ATPase [Cyanobium sp. CACIAM 14]